MEIVWTIQNTEILIYLVGYHAGDMPIEILNNGENQKSCNLNLVLIGLLLSGMGLLLLMDTLL